jgi:hypothetical protein
LRQCIFTLGTANLGRHTKTGSALIVMGVGGGAWYPSAQGSLADRVSTRRSYLVPASGYLAMLVYAVGLVIDQVHKRGFFSIWNQDPHQQVAVAMDPTVLYVDGVTGHRTDLADPIRVKGSDYEKNETLRDVMNSQESDEKTSEKEEDPALVGRAA